MFVTGGIEWTLSKKIICFVGISVDFCLGVHVHPILSLQSTHLPTNRWVALCWAWLSLHQGSLQPTLSKSAAIKHPHQQLLFLLWRGMVEAHVQGMPIRLTQTFPLTLSFVGLLLYGYMADLKGRKVAIKISWRMFTLGVLLYSLTQTAILRTLGYVIACVHCYPSLVCQFILLF